MFQFISNMVELYVCRFECDTFPENSCRHLFVIIIFSYFAKLLYVFERETTDHGKDHYNEMR